MNDTRILTEQKLNEEEQEILHRAYSHLDLFEQGCRKYHMTAREAREIARQNDPGQDEGNTTGEKTLQLQTLKSTINNAVADIVLSSPKAVIEPERPDLQGEADDLTDMAGSTLARAGFLRTYRAVAEDFVVTGTGIMHVLWDPDMGMGEGDVNVVRWPIEAFLWDPMATDMQEGRAVIQVSWHPLSWFETHYPDKYQYIGAESGQHNNVGRADATQIADIGDDEDRAMLMQYWYREYDPKKHRYTVNVAYCAGGALLEWDKNVYDHGMYPFVMCVYDRIEGVPVGEGLCSEMKNMMRYINRYARYIDMNARMGSKGRLLARRNSGIDREALRDWSVDIIEGDNIEQGQDWGWMQTAPLSAVVPNQMLRLQNDLKADSGQNSYTRGENTGGLVSGKAIMALQSAGSKVSGLRQKDVTECFRQMIEQVLWLYAQYYDTARVAVITGRDAMGARTVREAVVSREMMYGERTKGVLPKPPYSVRIQITHSSEEQIATKNELYMQAYSMSAQAQQPFPLSALFEMLEIDGKDKLLPVLQETDAMRQQMQMLAEQNQMLTEQNDKFSKENQSLKYATQQMAASLRNMRASGGMPTVGGMNQPTNNFGAGIPDEVNPNAALQPTDELA